MPAVTAISNLLYKDGKKRAGMTRVTTRDGKKMTGRSARHEKYGKRKPAKRRFKRQHGEKRGMGKTQRENAERGRGEGGRGERGRGEGGRGEGGRGEGGRGERARRERARREGAGGEDAERGNAVRGETKVILGTLHGAEQAYGEKENRLCARRVESRPWERFGAFPLLLTSRRCVGQTRRYADRGGSSSRRSPSAGEKD